MADLALLEGLLSIPSPSGQEDAVGAYLVEQMARLGFEATRDEAGNVVGRVGDPDAGRTIALLGHMDTVPGDIPVRKEAGRLYGRGAVDAKGPLAAFLLAAARVAPELADCQVQVIAAVEEEAQSRGARHLARTMEAPALAIIGEPSQWDSITLGYKGILRADYRLVQPGGHSAGQVAGPAEKAVDFWNKLFAYATAYNEGRSGRSATLDPALGDLNTYREGLNEAVSMVTLSRLPLGLSAATLQEEMETWRNGAQLKFYPSDPAVQADKNTPLVRALLRAIRSEGGRPRFKLKTGTSDMNVVGPVWKCPMVAYGPGDSTLDHTPNEHILVDEFWRSVDVLSHALALLAA
jgi:LysW-gamma-L-lysine carboxypeptidase